MQAKYDLAAIQEWAEMLLPTESIEIIMEMPEGYLKQAIAERKPEGMAVLRGRLIVEAKVRKCAIDLAIGGSAPAMIQTEGYLKEIQISEI